jgi:hypothetical protein
MNGGAKRPCLSALCAHTKAQYKTTDLLWETLSLNAPGSPDREREQVSPSSSPAPAMSWGSVALSLRTALAEPAGCPPSGGRRAQRGEVRSGRGGSAARAAAKTWRPSVTTALAVGALTVGALTVSLGRAPVAQRTEPQSTLQVLVYAYGGGSGSMRWRCHRCCCSGQCC